MVTHSLALSWHSIHHKGNKLFTSYFCLLVCVCVCVREKLEERCCVLYSIRSRKANCIWVGLLVERSLLLP